MPHAMSSLLLPPPIRSFECRRVGESLFWSAAPVEKEKNWMQTVAGKVGTPCWDRSIATLLCTRALAIFSLYYYNRESRNLK